MRLAALALTCLFMVILFAPTSSQVGADTPGQNRPAEPDGKIKQLQQERIATLKQAAEIADKLYKNARITPQEVCEAQLLVLRAELEAAGNDADRVAICQKSVDLLKNYEQIAAAAVPNARGTQVSALTVKASRLEAEILLEQTKARAAGEENK